MTISFPQFGNSFRVNSADNDRNRVILALAELASGEQFPGDEIRSTFFDDCLYICGDTPPQDQTIRDVFRAQQVTAEEYDDTIPGSCPRGLTSILRALNSIM